MKKFTIQFICLFSTIVSYSQGEAFVTFTSEKDITVKLFKPIDGAYQDGAGIVSEEFELSPQTSATRKIEVADFSAIRIVMKNTKIVLFLFPNDHLTVNYIDKDQIEITGSNAPAHLYYNRQFITPRDRRMYFRVQNGFMHNNFEETLRKEVKDSLELLQQNPEVSARLTSLLWEDISVGMYSEILSSLRTSWRNSADNEQKRDAITTECENIFLKIDFQNPNIIKLPLAKSILMIYYEFHKKSNQEKQALPQGYDENAFGPYASYLFAPDYIQLPLLGYVLFIEYKEDPAQTQFPYKLDFKKIYEHLKGLNPNSEYVAMLSEIEKTNDRLEPSSIHFISQPINSLSELSNLPEFKGQYLLVDFWATWCFPCRQEFIYKDNIKKILETHSNLACVYVSIDKDDRDSQWKTNVEKIPLSGHNIRAQENLINDIREKIFESKQMTIPRYILISPNGELIDINLPRPSDGAKLAGTIRKHLLFENQ